MLYSIATICELVVTNFVELEVIVVFIAIVGVVEEVFPYL